MLYLKRVFFLYFGSNCFNKCKDAILETRQKHCYLSDRLKDGKVAAEQCSRYHMDMNSLVIRDVAEEDAGKYTVLVRIQEHGLYQNLTLTLVVNGEKC